MLEKKNDCNFHFHFRITFVVFHFPLSCYKKRKVAFFKLNFVFERSFLREKKVRAKTEPKPVLKPPKPGRNRTETDPNRFTVETGLEPVQVWKKKRFVYV